jgi:hypothetical protein
MTQPGSDPIEPQTSSAAPVTTSAGCGPQPSAIPNPWREVALELRAILEEEEVTAEQAWDAGFRAAKLEAQLIEPRLMRADAVRVAYQAGQADGFAQGVAFAERRAAEPASTAALREGPSPSVDPAAQSAHSRGPNDDHPAAATGDFDAESRRRDREQQVAAGGSSPPCPAPTGDRSGAARGH